MSDLALYRVTGFPRRPGDHRVIEVAASSEDDAREAVVRLKRQCGVDCKLHELTATRRAVRDV